MFTRSGKVEKVEKWKSKLEVHPGDSIVRAATSQTAARRAAGCSLGPNVLSTYFFHFSTFQLFHLTEIHL
jgi:hypothetical protein